MNILDLLILILILAWLGGWGVFHVAGGLIHILFVLAVIILIIRLIQGRPVV